MDVKSNSYIDKQLLNKYLDGSTTVLETAEIEQMLATNSEAAKAFETLQTNLEIIAKTNAKEPPKEFLQDILEALETPKTLEIPKVVNLVSRRKTPWHAIAASVAALFFATLSLLIYIKNIALKTENTIVIEEIFNLRNDIKKNNEKLAKLSKQFMKINNPDTKKYVLSGNERAKNLKTVAYINPVDKTSMIDMITLPQLPEEQHYQIWAELQDRIVNLGILKESDRALKQIPYIEDALALSIRIGRKGDSLLGKHTEVAEISLKQNK